MKYTDSHEWIEVANGIGTVGVSNFAQKELGDIVFVELPIVGKKVKAGDEAAVLESTKAAADVYAPVSGEIVEVNQSLKDAAELINTSPERDGWIFKLRLTDTKELETLMDAEAYKASLHGK